MPTPINPITLDQYYIVTPAANFVSKAYGDLSGNDLFFYVDDLTNLRVVNFSTNTVGNITYQLTTGAKWVDVISGNGVVYVYYADLTGNVWYIEYTRFGSHFTPQALAISNVITLSTIFTPQSIPPAYMLMYDDGIRHHILVATDPMFMGLLAGNTVVYNNTLNTSIYVTRPSIAMHPSDTDRITVTCQELTLPGQVSSIGFYEFKAPGVS